MKLENFSDLVVVDELDVIPNVQNVFFLSHFDDSFETDPDFNALIYTSKRIANVLSFKEKKISPKYFKILKSDERTIVTLPNNDIIYVTMIEDDEPTGNVLFHFENSELSTWLYMGHFKNIPKLLKCYSTLIKEGVDYLYLDNTNSKSINHVPADRIGNKLKDILKDNNKIILNTPVFGYEEIIQKLLLDFKFKVFIENAKSKNVFYKTACVGKFTNAIKSANIVLRPESFNLDEIESRFKNEKTVTVRLYGTQKNLENKTYEKLGLYQLCYSPHISQFEMFGIISIIQPTFIKEIYECNNQIPCFIRSASKRCKYEENELENNQSFDDDEVTIESCANGTIANFELLDSNTNYNVTPESGSVQEIIEDHIDKIRNVDIDDYDKDCDIRNFINNLPKRKVHISKNKKNKEDEIEKKPIINLTETKSENITKTKNENEINMNTFDNFLERSIDPCPNTFVDTDIASSCKNDVYDNGSVISNYEPSISFLKLPDKLEKLGYVEHNKNKKDTHKNKIDTYDNGSVIPNYEPSISFLTLPDKQEKLGYMEHNKNKIDTFSLSDEINESKVSVKNKSETSREKNKISVDMFENQEKENKNNSDDNKKSKSTLKMSPKKRTMKKNEVKTDSIEILEDNVDVISLSDEESSPRIKRRKRIRSPKNEISKKPSKHIETTHKIKKSNKEVPNIYLDEEADDD